MLNRRCCSRWRVPSAQVTHTRFDNRTAPAEASDPSVAAYDSDLREIAFAQARARACRLWLCGPCRPHCVLLSAAALLGCAAAAACRRPDEHQSPPPSRPLTRHTPIKTLPPSPQLEGRAAVGPAAGIERNPLAWTAFFQASLSPDVVPGARPAARRCCCTPLRVLLRGRPPLPVARPTRALLPNPFCSPILYRHVPR